MVWMSNHLLQNSRVWFTHWSHDRQCIKMWRSLLLWPSFTNPDLGTHIKFSGLKTVIVVCDMVFDRTHSGNFIPGQYFKNTRILKTKTALFLQASILSNLQKHWVTMVFFLLLFNLSKKYSRQISLAPDVICSNACIHIASAISIHLYICLRIWQ